MRIKSKKIAPGNTVNNTLLSDFEDNINHGLCVSNLTYLLAGKLNLSEEVCHELAIAGLLHDIGKLKLSRYLYGRAESKMPEGDVEYMRMHSKLSYDILQKYDLSPLVLESVLYHHENYNGTGYPENRKGEDIPYGARVMRVADTFTALISNSPYRRAFDIDTAMEIMIDDIECYDMGVFLAFQQLIHEEETLEVIKSSKLISGVSEKDFSKVRI